MAEKPCHYQVLGLERSAQDNEIKRAYKKLALHWHPDKNLNNRQQATEMFRLIAEAYEVLGDPQKKSLYDAYGHQGVESGGDPRGPMGGAAAAAPGRGWEAGGPFHGTFRDPFEIFEAFFGPAAGRGGLFGHAASMRDFFPEPTSGRPGQTNHDDFSSRRGGGGAGGNRADRGAFGGDPFSRDPFFRGASMHQDMFRGFDDFFSSGFGGTGGVGGMNGFGATSGGFSSFSSSSMTIGPDGVPRTVSRTERTVVNPDGTRETKVEEFLDGVPIPAGGSLTGGPARGSRQEIVDTQNNAPPPRRRGDNGSGRKFSRLFGGGRSGR
ncbi:unnamed protein product [Ascophyllum nodosum]